MSPELVEFFNIVFRFTHVVAAIMWIGNSLLFTWMEVNFVKDPKKGDGSLGEMNMLHAGGVYFLEKRVLDPLDIPAKLHVFKWQSYTTWISGAILLITTFYTRSGTLLLDPSKTDMSGGMATAISIASLVGAWIVYDLVWHSPLKKMPPAAIAVLTTVLFAYAYWIDTFYNGRFVLLQLGAMIGTTMSANVRFVIIPNQKKIMAALLEGKPHDLEKGRQAKLRSLTNHYVTFPVIFLMLSAHFPSIYGDPYYLPIIFVISACLVVIKYMMNVYNKFKDWLYVSLATFTLGAGLVVIIKYIPDPVPESAAGIPIAPPSAEVIEGEKLFTGKGCMACHQPAASSIAPTLYGIYGTERRLADGGTALADETYLRESILQSTAKVSYGYAASMPGYAGAFTDEEVDQLVAYIKTLK
ncbi:MAG: urate hydroxylase PuuD [Verrucomicrobiota bacterium]